MVPNYDEKINLSVVCIRVGRCRPGSQSRFYDPGHGLREADFKRINALRMALVADSGAF
jgi:hypothetical protein